MKSVSETDGFSSQIYEPIKLPDRFAATNLIRQFLRF